MCEVIEVDDGAEFDGFAVFVGEGVIGGEHEVLAAESDTFGEDEFGEAGAVGAESFFGGDFDDVGVGECFNGEVFAEPGAPVESGIELSAGVANAGFVIEVEGSGIFGGNAANEFGVEGKGLLHGNLSI